MGNRTICQCLNVKTIDYLIDNKTGCSCFNIILGLTPGSFTHLINRGILDEPVALGTILQVLCRP
jgi:hypothetical protein